MSGHRCHVLHLFPAIIFPGSSIRSIEKILISRVLFHFDHVRDRNAFGDRVHDRNSRVGCLHDRVGARRPERRSPRHSRRVSRTASATISNTGHGARRALLASPLPGVTPATMVVPYAAIGPGHGICLPGRYALDDEAGLKLPTRMLMWPFPRRGATAAAASSEAAVANGPLEQDWRPPRRSPHDPTTHRDVATLDRTGCDQAPGHPVAAGDADRRC